MLWRNSTHIVCLCRASTLSHHNNSDMCEEKAARKKREWRKMETFFIKTQFNFSREFSWKCTCSYARMGTEILLGPILIFLLRFRRWRRQKCLKCKNMRKGFCFGFLPWLTYLENSLHSLDYVEAQKDKSAPLKFLVSSPRASRIFHDFQARKLYHKNCFCYCFSNIRGHLKRISPTSLFTKKTS